MTALSWRARKMRAAGRAGRARRRQSEFERALQGVRERARKRLGFGIASAPRGDFDRLTDSVSESFTPPSYTLPDGTRITIDPESGRAAFGDTGGEVSA